MILGILKSYDQISGDYEDIGYILHNVKQSVKVTTEWYYQVLKQKKEPSEVTNYQILNNHS